MLKDVFLSPCEFSKYLSSYQNHERSLLLEESRFIGSVSSTLTNNLVAFSKTNRLGSELLFRYNFIFWSDVTKIAEGNIKTSQRWENRLREFGSPISEVSVCKLQFFRLHVHC
jgi:hypothetical protein